MRASTMISALRTKFNLFAVDSTELDGIEGGIWIRDDICKEETDYYPYAAGTMQENKLNTFLERYGWYAEAYDNETIMLFEV